MPTDYFSDKERGPRPRTDETINQVVWDSIAALVQSLVADGSFGISFPDVCPDGSDVVGTNRNSWRKVLLAEHPEIKWPFTTDEVPATLAVLDLVEFTHGHIGKPVQGTYHDFFHHHHLSFDPDAGRTEFSQRINRLFARNGLAYELGAGGKVIRLAPAVLRESLQAAEFQTGDATLDGMLESARLKFLNPDTTVRREALEKLWDAWERIKTIEPGGDKKAQIKALLDKAAAEPKFRALIETEAKALTEAGNNFRIRHSETSQTEIGTDAHMGYLFHRLFSLIFMIIKMRGVSE